MEEPEEPEDPSEKTSKNRSSVNVINNELNFTDLIQKFVDKERLNGIKSDYNSVSIIGAQSSGKSTLMNLLFDTNFDELNMEQTGN